ncbi:hypothetical protein PMZ80_000098 [Knufia obscura]|uniref:Metallo-beta-lactamase domain-containing protein n=1 Tax=Knufia obscura TaxID=1635080 RepID=A0ABR0RZE8_9EURO|nr:hypothetical protein PMZ80_000098 [Knufia obscura]
MSVIVRHLNADSSFLLIFSPKEEPTSDDLLSVNGAFTVLIDPWLVGPSIVNAKWFAVTRRVVPSAISHLSEIEEPDVVLVSQNKPDHCHKQTLLQLRPEGKSLIAAEPGAAKAIKTWNHFDPNRVTALTKYDAKARFGNTLRLRIPPLGPDGLPGELNIAFIPARNYVTGLHNAYGITYQPPTRVKVLAPVTTIDLPRQNFSMPFTPVSLPAQSPQPMLSPAFARPASSYVRTSPELPRARPTTAPDNHRLAGNYTPRLSQPSTTRPPEFSAPLDHTNTGSSERDAKQSQTGRASTAVPVPEVNFDTDALINTTDFTTTLPTPPLSASVSSSAYSGPSSDISDDSPIPQTASTNTSFSSSPALPYSPSLPQLKSRYSRAPTIHPARPTAISCLYSPHGIPLSDLKPYIQHHLVPLPGALPLTCLFHSFDYASNPWWFGGNIMMGVDGGMEIARALMARCWVSAHDEVKDDRGVAVRFLRCERIGEGVVRRKIEEAEAEGEGRWECDVRALDVGEEVRLGASGERRRAGDGGVGLGLGLGSALDVEVLDGNNGG